MISYEELTNNFLLRGITPILIENLRIRLSLFKLPIHLQFLLTIQDIDLVSLFFFVPCNCWFRTSLSHWVPQNSIVNHIAPISFDFIAVCCLKELKTCLLVSVSQNPTHLITNLLLSCLKIISFHWFPLPNLPQNSKKISSCKSINWSHRWCVAFYNSCRELKYFSILTEMSFNCWVFLIVRQSLNYVCIDGLHEPSNQHC